MTPDTLRAAIASARLRPRMYAQTAEHLASMLYGMIAGAAPDRAAVNAAWCEAYACATPHGMTDAEVCDAAEATVAALWPQGDAPAGDECAAYSAAPLDTPMPPAFVDALAALSPAQPGALDLDAIEALARKVVSDDADGGYAMWSTLELARDRVPALVARVRELEAQLAATQPAALRCAACSAEWPPDARDCPGCGHPDRAAGAVPDRDLCPKCGALDLDHVCPKSAATAAGEAFAAEHPEAAGRILG